MPRTVQEIMNRELRFRAAAIHMAEHREAVSEVLMAEARLAPASVE